MKTIKERIPALLVAIGLLLYTTILLIIFGIGFSNKYEDDIERLEIENKKLEHQLQTSYNTIYDLRNENQECEYYIVPTEDGFVIDGQLYEKVEGYEAYE